MCSQRRRFVRIRFARDVAVRKAAADGRSNDVSSLLAREIENTLMFDLPRQWLFRWFFGNRCGWLSACVALGWLCLLPTAARADKLDDVIKRGVLRWGGDQEGGGPYILTEADSSGLPGFEVELAEMLAAAIDPKLKAEFKQGEWSELGPLMDRGNADIVLNGYELLPDRLDHYLCTRPYYCYGLQLLAPRDDVIKNWDDLAKKPGVQRTIGVLAGSAAETYMNLQFKNAVRVKSYNSPTDPMEQASTGVVEGTLQDDCIAEFYASRFPKLQPIGKPVALGYYVALVPKGEWRLQAALDRAIVGLIADGRLEHLYDKYRMHGGKQMQLLQDLKQFNSDPKLDALFKVWHGEADDTARLIPEQHTPFGQVVLRNLHTLLQAAGVTVLLSVTAMPLAVMIGILVAIGRLYGPWFLAKPLTLYVEVLRGTPLLLQLYTIYFIPPRIGIVVPDLLAAILGLAINYSAYEAEIYRAGFQAIPRGQMEAALSLGMSRGLAIRRILLPQAFRIVIPAVTNDFIALFKDTSVCSIVAVVELTKQYNVLATNTGAIVELALVTASLYMLMSYPLSLFARWSERRLADRQD